MNNESVTESVLLSYRIPVYKLIVLFTVMAVIFIFAVIAYFGLILGNGNSLPYTGSLIFLLLIMLVTGVLPRIVGRLVCTVSGIQVTGVMGQSVYYHAAWTDIKQVKKSLAGLVILKSQNRPTMIMFIPENVLVKFLSMLRETSNARIIGFEG